MTSVMFTWPESFLNVIVPLFELETSKKIKRIRADEGTEFLKEMKRDWEQMGIKYELTAAYSPESNGKAEVQNRILMNTVRAVLKQANMPPNFWLQALETAVYIWNRLPSTALPSRISPFDAHGSNETPLSLFNQHSISLNRLFTRTRTPWFLRQLVCIRPRRLQTILRLCFLRYIAREACGCGQDS